MKKLLVSGIALAGMLMVAGGVLAIRSSTQVKAENASSEEVQTLINDFLAAGSKKYTKKTQIFMTPEAQEDYKDCFHAGANALERTTYYDEATDALLMGNYDGTFGDGTTGINSGYRKSDENTMAHFFYKGHAEPSVDDLYINFKDTSTVANTPPNAFFKNLTDIATEAAAKTTWEKDGAGSFYYHFTDISIDEGTGDYNDGFLKTIQYFAAPMWLQNTAYFAADYVQIKRCTDWLSIRLYVSSADKDKLTVYDDGNGLLAEARVFSGLRFDEPTRYVLRGEWEGGWGTEGQVPLQYCADIRELEQYKLTYRLNRWVNFKIVDVLTNVWYGTGCLESGVANLFYWQGNTGEANIQTTATRDYTFYWKGTGKTLWVAAASLTLTIKVDEGWSNTSGFIGIHNWCKGYHNEEVVTNFTTWPGQLRERVNSFEVTINGMANWLIVTAAASIDASAEDAKTADIDISDAITTITVNADGSYTAA